MNYYKNPKIWKKITKEARRAIRKIERKVRKHQGAPFTLDTKDLDSEEAAYHIGPGISKSGLDCVERSPAHWFSRYVLGEWKSPSPDMVLGQQIHMALLQPHLFGRRYCSDADFFEWAHLEPTISKNTNKYKEAKKEWYAGGRKKQIRDSEFKRIVAIKSNLRANPIVKSLLTGGVAEQVLYWTDEETGLLCKAKADYLKPGLIVDLKSTIDASLGEFERSIWNFRYDKQGSFYKCGAEYLFPEIDETNFVLIATEKVEPFAHSVFVLAPDALDKGEETWRENLKTFAHCLETKNFPSYNKEPQYISIPHWAWNK